MAPSHKLLIVQSQDRVIGVQELRVEDDFYAVVLVVEELDAPELVQDRVVGVVGHVVRHDGRERVSAEGEHAPLEQDLVLFGEEGREVGDLVAGAVVPILAQDRRSKWTAPTQYSERSSQRASAQCDSESP